MTIASFQHDDLRAFTIRASVPGDLDAIHSMIKALAEFEKLSHLCVATKTDLSHALYGPRPIAEVLIASKGGETAAFALYFYNFSTFLGRPGIWLEDLFVRPAYRRQGCARALLRALATLARERGCARFEWAVLDWNTQAIALYESLGALILPDWRIARITGPALAAMAERPGDSSV